MFVYMENHLAQIVSLIAKVVDGESLTVAQAQRAFETIFMYDKRGYHFLALITALHTKKETVDELFGLIKTHLKLGAPLKLDISSEEITDLSGSGGGKIKTFNVSTTASFIVAAAGFKVLKNAYWAVTGLTGSADIFEAFGIKIKDLNKKKIVRTLKRVGISPIFYPLISPKLKNRGELSCKIFLKAGIKIRTPFHLVTNLISPVQMKYRIYGLYDKEYLETIAKLFIKLGYRRSLTFWAEGGLDEISNFSKTIVVEQTGNRMERYEITPEDLGLKRAKVEDIVTSSRQENIKPCLRILMGKERGPKADLVAANAGAAFYVMGKASSLKCGVNLARELIVEGAGFRVLRELVAEIGDKRKLSAWLEGVG